MNFEPVEKIANAVLYEGYMLYPYRPSAVKNRRRWNFGVVYPQSCSLAQNGTDPWTMQTECLILAKDTQAGVTTIDVKVRFLHLIAREVAELMEPLPRLPSDSIPEFRIVDVLRVGERMFYSWQEAVEREVTIKTLNIADLLSHPLRVDFTFLPLREQELESINSPKGDVVGLIIRRQEAIKGVVELLVSDCGKRLLEPTDPKSEIRLLKITVRIENLTSFGNARNNSSEMVSDKSRDEVLMHSFVSTHTLLGVRDGEFISLLDPPEQFRDATANCTNIGTWPVLVGEEGERQKMLSSPIILYDYPQVAPESTGDLFDGTEIDELLTLRIMTLTDEEKQEVRETDERGRQILERIETLPIEHLMKLHGAVRSLHSTREEKRKIEDNSSSLAIDSPFSFNTIPFEKFDEKPRLDRIRVDGVELRPGDRVRLVPRLRGTDIFDIALEGKTATIESIEQDYEDRIYLVVMVDEDPGKELGGHRIPAHRFFFSPEEVKPLDSFKERNG